MKLYMRESLSHRASRRHGPCCRAEAQGSRGGGWGGSRGAGARGGGRGGEGVGKDADRHRWAAGLQNHRTGDSETLLFVCFKHVGEAETLATHFAGVGLLPRVGAAVALHVGPAGEALPTDLANERLLPCTDKFFLRDRHCISQQNIDYTDQIISSEWNL